MNNNKIVVVTGGATGIGAAIARRFARAGARVAVLDLDVAGAEHVARACAEAGGDGIALRCDVADSASVHAAIAGVAQRWGGIDVLVNNAGLSHHSHFVDTRVDVVRRVLEVNFLGAVYCTAAALPSLRARRGVVVAMSSVAGFAPLLGRTGYAASKHALHGFFDSLRQELRDDGVAVLLVCPSYVDTAIDRHALAGDGSTYTGAKPVSGRLLTPDEVADAVFEATERRGPERVFVSLLARLSWWVSRVSPRAFAFAMRRSHRT